MSYCKHKRDVSTFWPCHTVTLCVTSHHTCRGLCITNQSVGEVWLIHASARAQKEDARYEYYGVLEEGHQKQVLNTR